MRRLLIDSRQDASGRVIACRLDPGPEAEGLIFLEVTKFTEIECAASFQDGSRTDLPLVSTDVDEIEETVVVEEGLEDEGDDEAAEGM